MRKPYYTAVRKCSSFFTWVLFCRKICGKWYPRIFGWDFYG